MRTTSPIRDLDFILPVLAIRLAAVTLTAWIFVAIHMERAPPTGAHVSPSAVQMRSPRNELPRLADEQLRDMLSHD